METKDLADQVTRVLTRMETNGARLNKIEEKLDELTTTMVTLARAEEKIEALRADHDKMYNRINKLSSKLDDIESKVDENARTVAFINKVVIAAVIAAIGAIVAQYIPF